MSKAAVLAAFPKEAQKLGTPADFAQPQHGSSLAAGSSDIAIPSYQGDGATFRVLFGFEQDALNRIHLAVPKATAGTCFDIEKAITDAARPDDRPDLRRPGPARVRHGFARPSRARRRRRAALDACCSSGLLAATDNIP